ncbi:hypothetical protein [Azoarcus olearius]|uniref:hypothetical protein n=1 Tax=Azoarcus sp. (strain BH72) TaxID=418699 RepID=UPI000806EBE1|nr:hypothetical protein [Azoarcus olearius]
MSKPQDDQRPPHLPAAKAVAGGINYSVRQLRIRVDELRRDAQWLSDLADAIEREDQDARTRAAK